MQKENKQAATSMDDVPSSPSCSETIVKNSAHLKEIVHCVREQYDLPIDGPEHPSVIKRLLRKGMRWYVRPIMEQQTEFNAYTVQTFDQVTDFVHSVPSVAERMEQLEYDMKNSVAKDLETALQNNHRLLRESDELAARMDALTKRIAELEEPKK